MYFRLIIFYLFILMSCAENNKTSNLEIPLRSDIDAKYKWDMTAVYPTEEAWEDDLNLVKKLYPRLGDYKGRLLSSPEVLLESIELRNQVNQTLWKLYHYASNSSNADVRNEKFQEMVQRVINESVKIGQTTAYYTPEILQNEYSVLEDLMANNTKLQVYEKQFKDLYISKPHILTEKEEKLLTMAGKLSGVSNDAYDIMRATDFVWPTFQDEDGNELTMSQGRYGKYTKSTDRRVREDMYKALYVPFKNNINTMSVLMKGNVEGHIFYSEARNYESTLEARMKRDGMSTDVYKNLINSVNDNLQPLHRWAEIKAKYLGLDKDININTEHPEFCAWSWMKRGEIERKIVPFKKLVYQKVFEDFLKNKEQTMNSQLIKVRQVFDKHQLISALHSFMSMNDEIYKNVLPPLTLLSENKKKELIKDLKEINFIKGSNLAA